MPGFLAACAAWAGRGLPGFPDLSRESPRPVRKVTSLPERYVLCQLGVAIGDPFASMAHPIPDDVLRSAQIAQAGDAEAPETMEVQDTGFFKRAVAVRKCSTGSTLKQECAG